MLDPYHRIRQRLTAPDAVFAIEQAIVSGHPVRIYKHAPASLSRMYADAEARFCDATFVREGDAEWTLGQIATAARRYAAMLIDEFGIEAGARVGIAMRNRPEWFVAFMAVTAIGGVAVLLNSRGSANDLVRAVESVPCRVVIADDRRGARLRDSGLAPILPAPDVAALLGNQGRPQQMLDTEPDAPAAIVFTSGTTGQSKGAVLSHRALCHTAHNVRYLREVGLAIAADARGVTVDDLSAATPAMSSVLVFPLFHVSGLTSFFMSLTTGGCINTIPRWDPSAAMKIIEDHQVTLISGPALVLSDLLDQPEARRRLTRIVNAGVGGQATPASLASRLSAVLPTAQQGNGWGMTELAGTASAATGALFMARPQSCGPIFPVLEVRTVDGEGRMLGEGMTGELCVRGPVVMTCYFDAPEATDDAVRDGWLHTGDIGRVDRDGFVFLIDRKKDMVISAGENISCAEIESVLSADHRLIEVAVFGVADERLGERAVAAVTVREGAVCTAEDLLDRARVELADYKVPREIEFDLGRFPRNVLGKVDKNALRALYLARRAASG